VQTFRRLGHGFENGGFRLAHRSSPQ
jgi:hypothetical protein